MKKFLYVILSIYIAAIFGSIIYASFFTGIIDSTRSGNTKRLERLLSHNKDKGLVYQALNYAVANNQADALKILLARIDNLDYIGQNRSTLSSAVTNQNKEILQMLLSKGAAKDSEYFSYALNAALTTGRYDLVELLVHTIAEPDFKTINGPGPFSAAHKDHLKIIKLMIEKGVPVDGPFGQSAAESAVNLQDYELLELLKNKGASKHFTAALSTALWQRNKQMVDFLVSNGASFKNKTAPLSSAFLHESRNDMLEYVLEKSIPVDDSELYSLLLRSCYTNNLETAKVLLSHGVDANGMKGEKKTLPLFVAINSGNPQMVQLLLEHGASTKLKDASQRSVFEILEDAKNTMLDWFDIGHKKDYDTIYKMLKNAESH